MLNLQKIAVFVAVVEAGNITRAARALRKSKAVVSFNLRQLEASLKVALFMRSTHRLTLTEAGEGFYSRALSLLQQARALEREMQGAQGQAQGRLRVACTPEYGASRLAPALIDFGRDHPLLRLELVSSPACADLIADGVDVAIRLGTLADSAYRAALIERFAIVPVAAPCWLRAHPISSLDDLSCADWIIHRQLSAPLRWQITAPGGEVVPFSIALASTGEAKFSADTPSALLTLALGGGGVALLPDWLAAPALAAGSLCQLLAGWRFPLQGVYAVYPDTPHVPAKSRLFIDFLRKRAGQV